MQDKETYKSGIKTFLSLVAVVRELARRSGDDAEEVSMIAHDALDECFEDAEQFTDEYINLQAERAAITADFLGNIIANHVVERAMAETGDESNDYS